MCSDLEGRCVSEVPTKIPKVRTQSRGPAMENALPAGGVAVAPGPVHSPDTSPAFASRAMLAFLLAVEAQEEEVIRADWDMIPRRWLGLKQRQHNEAQEPRPHQGQPRSTLLPSWKWKECVYTSKE